MLSPIWTHEPGALVRAITPADLDLQIHNTAFEIKAALRAGNMDRAWILVGRQVGLKWCLRNPLYG